MTAAGPSPGGLPAAGWYPDPWPTGGMRWWDGAGWTGHAAGAVVGSARPEVAEGERLGARARTALAWAIPASVVTQATALVYYRSMLHGLRDATRRPGYVGYGFTPNLGASILLQVVSMATLVVAVLFLMWFSRAANNARALGLPSRREPRLAVLGYIIPIVNFWWPYQSTCDLLPQGHPGRSKVLRWWLLWILGGMAAGVMVVVGTFAGGPISWVLVGLSAAVVSCAALAAREVIAVVCAAHRGVASGRAGSAGPG